MAEQQEATMPTVWFLYSEDGEPLGQVYRRGEEAIPVEGVRITNGAKWKSAEVLSFSELTSTCAMRRFRVVVRLVE
ncbi:MAG: hypothetical protein IIC84_07445 [Chloroflexi bacterium]|nr:hypothetical protein [Chloroflexota bacterium]